MARSSLRWQVGTTGDDLRKDAGSSLLLEAGEG
jgi:hypothetical protein